jgi:hypothetical protein
VSNLIAKRESSSYKEGEMPAKRVRAKRRCSCCSKVRHNFCTCKVEIEDVDNSKESKVQSTIVYSKINCCSVRRCYCVRVLVG